MCHNSPVDSGTVSVRASQLMRLRRAVLQISAKSSVPPRLPFHKNHLLPTRSQSTLPQPLISLHFNSFRSNVYKKTGGAAPAAYPKVCQLVTRHKPRLRTRRNSPQPSCPHGAHPITRGPHRGWGMHPLSGLSFSVPSALKSPFRPATDFSPFAQTDPRTSSLSLFTTPTHYSPPTTHSLFIISR